MGAAESYPIVNYFVDHETRHGRRMPSATNLLLNTGTRIRIRLLAIITIFLPMLVLLALRVLIRGRPPSIDFECNNRVTAMVSAFGKRTNGREYRRWQPIGGPVDLLCVRLGESTRPYICTGTGMFFFRSSTIAHAIDSPQMQPKGQGYYGAMEPKEQRLLTRVPCYSRENTTNAFFKLSVRPNPVVSMLTHTIN